MLNTSTLVHNTTSVTFQESYASTMTVAMTANLSSTLAAQDISPTLTLNNPASSLDSLTSTQISASPVTTMLSSPTSLRPNAVSFTDGVNNSTQFSSTTLSYSYPISKITSSASIISPFPTSPAVLGSTTSSPVNSGILSLSLYSSPSTVIHTTPSLPDQTANLNFTSSVTSSADAASLSGLSASSMTLLSTHGYITSSSDSLNVWNLTQTLPHVNSGLDSMTATQNEFLNNVTSTTDIIETTVVNIYEKSTASYDNSTQRVLYGNTTDSWDVENTTIAENYDNATSATTDIWNSTQETPYNTTDIISEWNITEETPYNTTYSIDIGNTTQEISFNTTNFTDFLNTTQEATTTILVETTTPLTTAKPTPVLTTIKTTTRSTTLTTSTKPTFTTTTEVPIHEYALTVPVIIGITVGLIVLTALIFIMLLWRRHVKQDHSVNVPRRYSVNSTKSSSFKHRSLYGQMSHERHPSFAPVYYGETDQSQSHRPVRMSSYKIKDGGGQPTITDLEQIRKNSRDSVKRLDEEVKKEKVKESHSFPYEKRRLKSKQSLSMKGIKDKINKESDTMRTNGDINSHESDPPTIKINGFHDSHNESMRTPSSLEDTRL